VVNLESWPHEHYKAGFSPEINVVVGLPAKRGACSWTVNFNQILLALACHPDFNAVGLQLGGIIILDAITGTSTSILRSGGISRLLAGWVLLTSESSDKTIRLWDIQTSRVVETFRGHSSGVLFVFISPDSVDAKGEPDGPMDMVVARAQESVSQPPLQEGEM